MKKFLTFFMAAMLSVAMVSCGDKDNDGDDQGDDNTTVVTTGLEQTQWRGVEGDMNATNTQYLFTFVDHTVCNYLIRHTDGNDPALDWDKFYVGNYTYSNGRGTVTMEQSGKAEGSFTIDGSTMELTFGGQTISMSKLNN